MKENKIVVVDFSGTLIKPFVAEEANLIRYRILGIPTPSKEEHAKLHGTKGHYDIIKEHISKIYGIKEDMNFKYVQNYGSEIDLSGKDIKTMIMTDLFRICMYEVAAKHKLGIYADGLLDSLKKIQKKGFKLAIVSGVREDIITGLLEITRCPIKFDYLYGQDPVLSREDNLFLDKELSKQGKIEYILGDKLEDLEPAKKLKAKSIFVTWGHATGGEKEIADYTIKNAKELEGIIQ
ncbi:MAG: HAD hydrolase-like protein [Candidatus Nanoarchaeia archaeon]|nr:HAD hydrolase-like protein [Candidatus Nanoarchaeia archaeon]MDD5588107.1 HAD hydrolase-like protein [Candidatus Nanoarchaeia archaeon]